jgi:XTP/dITP diphosphohydrolase
MARRLSRGSRVVLASHNKGKLREIAELVAPYDIDMVPAGELGLPEPDETEADFYGNARLKAATAARASGLPALADDSGFCVAGLSGQPGVLSARWAGPKKDFAAAMARVAGELAGSAEARAWFVCLLSLAWPDGESASFLGRVEGNVTWPPRGSLGFGYDPMFVKLGGTLTYGEMAPAEKHASSHRARAMAQLAAACLPRRESNSSMAGVIPVIKLLVKTQS